MQADNTEKQIDPQFEYYIYIQVLRKIIMINQCRIQLIVGRSKNQNQLIVSIPYQN